MSDTTAAPEENVDKPEPPAPPKRNGAWGWVAAGGLLLLSKAKLLLGLLKFAKLGKFALTALSMVVMIGVEAQRSGPAFAVGFVVLILVHELGHGYAIRQAGLRAGPIVFLPFMGAVIALKDQPQNAKVEAQIAFGGPFIGSLGAIACAALYLTTHQRLWLALAYTGFFLNLFNLVPVTPLDGGRITQAFSRKTWILGLVVLGVLFLVAPSPQLAIISVMAMFNAFSRRRSEYPELSDGEKTGVMLRYFGLAGFLGAAVYFSHELLSNLP